MPHDDDLTAQLLALRPDVARRVARRRYGGRLEDKTQEAMLRAHRRLGSYRPSVGPLRPWVLGIASNVDRTFRRAERRYRAVFWPDFGEAERTAAPGPSPERHAQLSEARAKLSAAIQDMPSSLLAALLLVCVEGASMKEAGEELGISESAAKVRVHRARAYLRERLQDCEDDLLTVLPPGLLGEPANEEHASATGGLFNAVFPGGHLWSGIMVAVVMLQPGPRLTARCGLEPITMGLPAEHAPSSAEAPTRSGVDRSAVPIPRVKPTSPSRARPASAAPSSAPSAPPQSAPAASSTLDIEFEKQDGRTPVDGQ
ncbi:RNA polymerase sigma factor [Polyangium aurulentum]|uniref:RNA polymerase sigma factor n=1 Tax=Polyangium aurulentum TaxID=2567896 RepID=UPI00200BD573|nr:RNA polymerase sigma factor [Polyangium aurulentum]UQA60398.1 RNA polymerase sigma factor [Polyangium aurulentum]